MAYSHQIKHRARDLVYRGHNFEEIEKILREDSKGKRTPDARTISKWANRRDPETGERWLDLQERAIAQQAKQAEQRAMSLTAEFKDKSIVLARALYEQMTDPKSAPRLKSAEGGGNLFISMARLARDLEAAETGLWSPYAVAETILRGLMRYPKVAKALEPHLDDLMRWLADQFAADDAAAMRAKAVDGEMVGTNEV